MALAGLTIKRIALWLTVVAFVSNVYIFTYPSLAPEQCSWKSDDSKRMLNVQDASVWEKFILGAKIYVKDVWQERFSKAKDVSNKENVPDVHLLALGDPQINGIWANTPYMTRLDIFGNDYYLGHIFRKMKSRLAPTHVAIMGDLFSSQWIGDSEFFNRTMRLTRRVLGRDGASLSEIQKAHHDEEGLFTTPWEQSAEQYQDATEVEKRQAIWKYENVWGWNENDEYLLINITGNHDVGYSGDCTYQHMCRYGQLFGSDNYWIEYDRDTDHPWRIVVLNDLLLDGPALQPEFVNNTWEFLYQLFERKFEGSTVLLTHIPFYKEAGLCFDGPEFNYYPEEYEREPYKSRLLRSQNHLSEDVTNRVLTLLFSNGKPGVILTGHDHEGCQVIYNQDLKKDTWKSARTITSTNYVKEVTVRSMMGQYGGNTGLLTGHFCSDTKNWEWSYSLCPFAVQHIWWFTKVTTILAGLFASLAIFF